MKQNQFDLIAMRGLCSKVRGQSRENVLVKPVYQVQVPFYNSLAES